MIKIKIGEKDFQLKFTIESWKKLKEHHDITPANFETKVGEDMANILSAMIFYGLLPEDRKEIKRDQIDATLDFSSFDLVSEAIMEGMPESSRKLARKLKDQQGGEEEEEEVPEKK